MRIWSFICNWFFFHAVRGGQQTPLRPDATELREFVRAVEPSRCSDLRQLEGVGCKQRFPMPLDRFSVQKKTLFASFIHHVVKLHEQLVQCRFIPAFLVFLHFLQLSHKVLRHELSYFFAAMAIKNAKDGLAIW